jgi:hypothetical protein
MTTNRSNSNGTIKQAVIEAAIETIGAKCREDVRENNVNRQICYKYKEIKIKADKIIRNKKKPHLKMEIENIGLLTNQNDSSKFYQAIKKLNIGLQPRLDICKDKNGNVLGDKSEIMNRWFDYSEKLLIGKINKTPKKYTTLLLKLRLNLLNYLRLKRKYINKK